MSRTKISRTKIRGFPGAERLEHARKAIVAVTPKARKKARRRRATGWVAAGLGAGAALTYFFDPSRGKARRAVVVGRAAGAARTVGRKLGRAGRYAGSTAAGVRQRVVNRTRDDVPVNDIAESDEAYEANLTRVTPRMPEPSAK